MRPGNIRLTTDLYWKRARQKESNEAVVVGTGTLLHGVNVTGSFCTSLLRRYLQNSKILEQFI